MVTRARIGMVLVGLAAVAAWSPAAALPDVHLNSTCGGLGFEGTAHEKGKMIHFMSCPAGREAPPVRCHARIWTEAGALLREVRLEARPDGEAVIEPAERQPLEESPEAEVARCLVMSLERMGMDPDSPSMRCFNLQMRTDDEAPPRKACE